MGQPLPTTPSSGSVQRPRSPTLDSGPMRHARFFEEELSFAVFQVSGGILLLPSSACVPDRNRRPQVEGVLFRLRRLPFLESPVLSAMFPRGQFIQISICRTKLDVLISRGEGFRRRRDVQSPSLRPLLRVCFQPERDECSTHPVRLAYLTLQPKIQYMPLSQDLLKCTMFDSKGSRWR